MAAKSRSRAKPKARSRARGKVRAGSGRPGGPPGAQGTRPAGAPEGRAGHLRGGLRVRARAPRLPAGRRVRARGADRASRGRRAAAPGLRARGVGRHPGAHLLRAPREAAGHRPREGPGADEPRGAAHRQVGGAQDRHAVRRRHLQHQHLRPGRQGRAQGGRAHLRRAGRLGGGSGGRLLRRRDLLLGRRGAHGARRHPQVLEGAGGGDARDPQGPADARGTRRRPRRASAWRGRARTWWASTAIADLRPCCRCSRRSARR